MTDPRQFALNMLMRNPNVANNPNTQYMASLIQNGNSEQGKQVAENICRTYGVTPDQALQRAKQFFHLQ